MNRQLLILACAVFCSFILLVLAVRMLFFLPDTNSSLFFCPLIRAYSSAQIASAMGASRFGRIEIKDVTRTSDARGIVIDGIADGEAVGCVWIIKNGTIRWVKGWRGIPFVDENGRTLAWLESNSVHFVDGVTLTNVRIFCADVRGLYFSVTDATDHTSVGRIGKEKQLDWECTNFVASSIVNVGYKLFILGTEPATNPACIVLANDLHSHLVFKTRIELGYPGKILGVVPGGQALFFQRKDHSQKPFYFYNIESARWERCYPSEGQDWYVLLYEDPLAKPGGLRILPRDGSTNAE